EYYYVVEHDRAGTTIVAHRIEPTEHGPRVGEIVRRVAVPQPLASSSSPAGRMVQSLPRVMIKGVAYFRDDRLQEYCRRDNPHERIGFDELLDAA
ncbi:MAG: hypothetical protein ACSLE8_17795, partial [Rhodococcus sp. (in: high G+C Gram-positive bacteria)]